MTETWRSKTIGIFEGVGFKKTSVLLLYLESGVLHLENIVLITGFYWLYFLNYRIMENVSFSYFEYFLYFVCLQLLESPNV